MLATADPDADGESPVRQPVDGREVLRDLHRRMSRQDDDRGAEPHSLGQRSGCRELDRPRVTGEGDAVGDGEARPRSLVDGAAPRDRLGPPVREHGGKCHRDLHRGIHLFAVGDACVLWTSRIFARDLGEACVPRRRETGSTGGGLTRIFRTLRSVLRFEPVETGPGRATAAPRRGRRRPAPDRRSGGCRVGCSTTSTAAPRTSARCAPTPTRSRASTFRPRVLRGRRRRRYRRPRCSAGRSPFPLVLAPTGFTRIADPDGELAVARARPRGRAAVHAVDARAPVRSRRSRAVSDRAPLVPGVRLARPRARQGDDRAGGERRLRGARAHGRHRGARTPRARRAPRVHAAAEDRARHAGRRRAPPGVDLGLRARRADQVRQRRRSGRGRRQRRRCRSPTTSTSQFDPALSWHDVEWIRSVWDGPIVVKGIQTVADARPRGRCRRRGHRPVEPRRSPARLRAGAASTSSPRSPTRSGTASRSSATAACGGAATSSRRSRSARARAWPGGRTSTRSVPRASAGSTTCSRLLDADVRRTMALVGARTVADLGPDLVALPSGP